MNTTTLTTRAIGRLDEHNNTNSKSHWKVG